MPELILYYKPTCPFCREVLNFMEQNNISVTLKNTNESSAVRDELRALGGKTQVPCLVIDGKALYESADIIQWFKDNMIST